MKRSDQAWGTMRVVVCTIVHHPADARIYHRQIRALLDAGHEVTYIAPVELTDFHPERGRPSLHLTAVPRASGRRRAGAIMAARSALAGHAAGADLMLVHDPELLLALPPRRRRPPVIWDVHEDTAAALSIKPWLPRWHGFVPIPLLWRWRPNLSRTTGYSLFLHALEPFHSLTLAAGLQHLPGHAAHPVAD